MKINKITLMLLITKLNGNKSLNQLKKKRSRTMRRKIKKKKKNKKMNTNSTTKCPSYKQNT